MKQSKKTADEIKRWQGRVEAVRLQLEPLTQECQELWYESEWMPGERDELYRIRYAINDVYLSLLRASGRLNQTRFIEDVSLLEEEVSS